ncbi:MAG: tetratricopeptide repeat protein, partial [Kutzneria sp.]|nr:tetratricopeptide repeat protein [Kutzneria sp.]
TQVRPYLLLGDAAVRIRDFSTAERAYRAALRKAPDDSRIRVQLTRLRRRVPDARPADRPDITQLFQQSARPVCAVVVGLITLLVVAGGSRPAPLLAWGGLVLPPVVAVLALAALVRAPSGSRLALAAAPCRSPLAALACVLLVSALGLALWWAVLINAGSQTIITLVLAWICAAGAGGLTFVRSGWPADR